MSQCKAAPEQEWFYQTFQCPGKCEAQNAPGERGSRALAGGGLLHGSDEMQCHTANKSVSRPWCVQLLVWGVARHHEFNHAAAPTSYSGWRQTEISQATALCMLHTQPLTADHAVSRQRSGARAPGRRGRSHFHTDQLHALAGGGCAEPHRVCHAHAADVHHGRADLCERRDGDTCLLLQLICGLWCVRHRPDEVGCVCLVMVCVHEYACMTGTACMTA